MSIYSTRLYIDTGFSPENIPDDGKLLDNNAIKHLDVDAIWLYQNQEVGAIRVKANYDSIYPVDYCKISSQTSSSYYFVTGVTMLNPNTAQLNLQIDAVTTIGLKNITNNITGGWCIRRHVNNDELFSNNIEESFTPAEPLIIDFKPFVSRTDAAVIIASTLDLDNIEYIAKTFEDAEHQLSVTVPQMPTITNGTIVNIHPQGGKTYSKTLPNIRLYNYSRNPTRYSKALSVLWSLGMVDSITSIYNIAGNDSFTYLPNDSDGVSGSIVEITFDGSTISTDTQIPYKWNVNVKNNKVFCDQFNKLTIASFTSGDELDYEPSDLYQSGDTTFKAVYWHDPSPTGKTYIRPVTFQGLDCSTDAIFFQCVTGSTWQNTQASFQGQEGWAINKKLYGLNVQKQGYDHFFNLLGGAKNLASTTSNIDKINAASPEKQDSLFMNNISGLLGSIHERFNLSLNKRASRINYIADNALVSPTIKFPRDGSLIDIIGNGFFILRCRLSDSDSKRFDRYLTEYGYAVNEPLTSGCFYGRQYFNYIEATEINIKSIDKVPMRLKQLAIQQLEGGIRIWHTLVNPDAYNNNPIVGG